MILDGEDPKKEKAPVVPAIQEEVKPIEQISDNAAPVSNTVASTGSNETAAHVVDPKQSDIQPAEQSSKKFESNADIVDAIYKARMPTEEELAKERKREKSRQVISAIADGVSAISNLYFTGKGAKNVEQTSMSAANTKRYQEILDRRRRMQDKWDDARLSAYDRDRGFNYQKYRDDANWKRSGEWHEDQVKTDGERFDYNRNRTERIDAETRADRDRNYELSRKGQEIQEKGQKDASARGWAAVGAQDKRIKAQEKKQNDYVKYQFEKANGSPGPKRINDTRSIYVGKNTWEQNAGQIAGEIIKDIEKSDPALAKQLTRQLNGFAGKKGADAKQTAAIVDKYIMNSPSAQELAIELEKDYKKRYELAANGALPQTEEDPYAKYAGGDDPYAKYAE